MCALCWSMPFQFGTVHRLLIKLKGWKECRNGSVKYILGQRYQGYSNALSLLGLCTLAERRVQLCLDFARKLYKSSQVYTSLETGYHHSGSRWLDARWETTANRKIQDINYSLYVETFKQLRILNERIDVFSFFFYFIVCEVNWYWHFIVTAK